MYCKNCGQEIDDNVLFCKYCGTKVEKADFTPRVEPMEPQAVPPQFYQPVSQVGDTSRILLLVGAVILIVSNFLPAIHFMVSYSVIASLMEEEMYVMAFALLLVPVISIAAAILKNKPFRIASGIIIGVFYAFLGMYLFVYLYPYQSIATVTFVIGGVIEVVAAIFAARGK